MKSQIGWVQVNKIECKVKDKIPGGEMEPFEILSQIGDEHVYTLALPFTHRHTHLQQILRSNKSVVSFARKEFIDEFWIKRKSFLVKWNTNQMSIIDGGYTMLLKMKVRCVCMCGVCSTQRETAK